ncbi:MAG: adenosylcobalamin-dependent ribonucleoside-diphosphate reductase [Candidatus Sungbacteria bacterium]|nr:adenosylcobalamin-dependent ribonucleoside-diphosphate reductase [Candidatus Sungbacteria bacterium]
MQVQTGARAPIRINGRAKKLPLKRVFTKVGVHPFDEVGWKKIKVIVRGSGMNNTVEERELEFPDFWSDNAATITGAKYFRGRIGSDGRETSVKQMISRVVSVIRGWGLKFGYFDTDEEADVFGDELAHILLYQKAAFNSPVWFNFGIEDPPQGSACFILSVDDSMESILKWINTEGMIFKRGSGSGVNLSPLRSSRETLSAGGRASGPVSFMRGADAVAGSIASGGSTRRAAKMVVLNADHPDVMQFIRCKAEEERKVRALIEQGYNMYDLNDPAWNSIQYQNANNSVRVTDEFMHAFENDETIPLRSVVGGEVVEEVRPREIMRSIAQAAWECGDPGMQYDTTINRWHTASNTGRINASNPCSEYMHLDDSACNLASINLITYLNSDQSFNARDFTHTVDVMILAQEIIVDGSRYPTEKIGQNARDFRELGLGYANLGALLMTWGLPYDSEKARHTAAAITALTSGEAYRYSAEIARRMGPYAGFAHNREPQINVIAMHCEAMERVRKDRMADKNLHAAAQKSWDEALALARRHGVRNSQVSVLAPTGCLVGGSLVSTDRGLVRLQSLGNATGDRWQDINISVGTDQGPQHADKFYRNGTAQTRRIFTENGYEIQGTLHHRIRVVEPFTGAFVWKRFADLQSGDVVPLAMNQMIGDPRRIPLPPVGDLYWTANYDLTVPREVTEDLATVVGYYMGDGSLHAKGLRFCVSKGDEDVIERVHSLIKSVFGVEAVVREERGYWEVAIHSVPLTFWWEACGFSKKAPIPGHRGKGYTPHIPDAILATNNRAVYGAFLRGLFEADGSVTYGVPSWSTTAPRFLQEVKTMLLTLGFPTKTKVDNGAWRFGTNDVFVLRLKNNTYSQRFLSEIGFLGVRKRAAVMLSDPELSGKRDYIYVNQGFLKELLPVGPAGREHRNAVMLSLRRHGAISRHQIEYLREQTEDQYLSHALGFFYDKIASNEDGGEQPTYDLSVPSNVTYIANGFISHNTIALMMDCATTGVEPEFALVKMKKLVGGGTMKFVNTAVSDALKTLGYDEEERSAIAAHIEKEGTIEGAPGFKDEHLAVFDCAVKPANGKRSISWQGHVKMVASIQPFISGAISKTFNMPHETTAEEIMDAYVMGWKMGLKAFAVYRDGSKAAQPLTTSTGLAGKDARKTEQPIRRRLPATRPAETHKFSIAGHEGYITYGMYENGELGELFITMSKQGSTLAGLLDVFATSISIALQYGVPLKTWARKFAYGRYEPAGYTENPDVQIATSITDYIFRYLALRFLSADDLEELGIKSPHKELNGEMKPIMVVSENPMMRAEPVMQAANVKPIVYADSVCRACGGMLIQTGSCKTCIQCGTSNGGC